MREITARQKLLDKDGNLINAGYAKHMYFDYDKKLAKRPAFSLKEWDFYQIHFGHTVLQMTIGHVSYCADASATVIDLDTGKRRTVSSTAILPGRKRKTMPTDPEAPNKVQVFGKNFHMQFLSNGSRRRLTLCCSDKYGVKADIDVLLTNCDREKEKMVIATPFGKKRRWYLNYKENCFSATGHCAIDDMRYEIENGFGLLDWGRGVWPFSSEWVWGNGGTVVDGKHFGFNIGWGFGDTSAATENMFFFDNKAYKLGVVKETKSGEKLRYKDDAKRFDFTAEPIFDNFTKRDVAFIHTQCHQVFGIWKGSVVLDDGSKIKIPPFLAFCERAENRW